jgi:hypothetical protein
LNLNVQSENLRRCDIDPTKKAEIIKENLKEMGLEAVDQICMLQDGDQWLACVNVVMNLYNQQVVENIMISCAITVV